MIKCEIRQSEVSSQLLEDHVGSYFEKSITGNSAYYLKAGIHLWKVFQLMNTF